MKVLAEGTWFDKFLFELPGEIYVSFIIVFIVLILGIIVSIKARKTDPFAKPKGLMNAVEILVSGVDNLTESAMGPRFKSLSPYFLTVGIFIFLNFMIGLVGLPTPTSVLVVPLVLSLMTVILIHATSIKYSGWGYFKRYTEPVIAFLPMNLISQVAPLISLTMRLFGNTVAGWAIMGLVYWALEMLSTAIFGGLIAGGAASIWLAPLITPWLHLYFDLFSGFIQTYVFMMLSMMFISQEGPDDDEVPTKEITDKAGNKITILAKEN